MRLPIVCCVLGFSLLVAETPATAEDSPLAKLLQEEIVGPTLPLAEIQRYCEDRVPKLGEYKTASEWESAAERMRKEMFEKVIYRGQAAEWRKFPMQVEWRESIAGGPGYRIKKLRYQILPNLWVPAVLYEPEKIGGLVPVVLNVNGHETGLGKAVDYKQIRCINLAKRGMLALSLEWFGMGQLNTPGFSHESINQLDLCGASGMAPFYLSMERALDILLGLPHADPKRVAVTGLSGGGWQTCLISGLDRRVTLSNAVAGYAGFRARIAHPRDFGDSEQVPADMATVFDYTHLTAMRAPQAALLTYNAKDNCCFVADGALKPLLDAARPIFQLYDRADALQSHVNDDPGTHNYEIDNRQVFYRLVGEVFYPGAKDYDPKEIPCKDELKSKAELEVPLPPGSTDFNSIARDLAKALPQKAALPTDEKAAREWIVRQRTKLREIVGTPDYQVTAVKQGEQTQGDLKTTSWKLLLGDAWSIPLLELEQGKPRATALLVTDAGRGQSAADVERLLKAGYRVLAADPTFYGETMGRKDRNRMLYALMLNAEGQRPLGLETGQVTAIARWAAEPRHSPVSLVSSGPRSSLTLLVAAALEEKSIAGVELHESLGSLKETIEKNWDFPWKGPEFFCFGLLEDFDLRQIAALVAPRPVIFVKPAERVVGEMTPLTDWYRLLGKTYSADAMFSK
jgi:hypothetical protein